MTTPANSTDRRPLFYGEPLALEHAASNRNHTFALGALGGRFALICVIADASAPEAQIALETIPRDPRDETSQLCAIFSVGQTSPLLEALKEHRLVFNDAEIARACGLVDPSIPAGRWLLFDPMLRLIAAWKLEDAAHALQTLEGAPSPSGHAPVLIVDKVFESAFCADLIKYYRDRGGEASGITQQDADGRTFVVRDDGFKRRSDCLIQDAALREGIMQRLYWRLAPMIERAFMWRPTRMERYLIAAYDAESSGFFKAHRDNTTHGTAHRRFAVTINLNAGEFEGGDLRFPEFGPRTYRAPTGGAVVFSCGLLHEALPVTKGTRYAFLPFLYDDTAAKVREQNVKFLDESLKGYRDER